MANDQVTYYYDGYVGNNMEVIEYRSSEKHGLSRYLWTGLYKPGANHVKLINPRPLGQSYDKVKRPRENFVSIFDLKRRD